MTCLHNCSIIFPILFPSLLSVLSPSVTIAEVRLVLAHFISHVTKSVYLASCRLGNSAFYHHLWQSLSIMSASSYRHGHGQCYSPTPLVHHYMLHYHPSLDHHLLLVNHVSWNGSWVIEGYNCWIYKPHLVFKSPVQSGFLAPKQRNWTRTGPRNFPRPSNWQLDQKKPVLNGPYISCNWLQLVFWKTSPQLSFVWKYRLDI